MTRDDIILIAKAVYGPHEFSEHGLLHLEHFAALVAAAEREACIKVIESYQIPVGNSPAGELACDWTYDALKQIRDEIRERGVK
jgi:hypothetical protein